MRFTRKMRLIQNFGIVFVAATIPTISLAQDAVQGNVIVGRATHGAVILWDATPEIVDIVQKKLSDQTANDKLERDGLRALASKLRVIPRNNPSITLRITYQKIAAVNSEYGNPTFADVAQYATIVLNAKWAFANRDHWTTLGPGMHIPSWVQFKVTAQLPPR